MSNKISHKCENLSATNENCGNKIVPYTSSAGSTLSVNANSSPKRSLQLSRVSSVRLRQQLLVCCADDPRTTKGQRKQLLKILGMAALPIIILVIQSSLTMRAAVLQQSFASSFKEQVQFSMQAGYVVYTLGLERGTTTFYVSIMDQDLFPSVLAKQFQVDQALERLTLWPNRKVNDSSLMRSKEEMKLSLQVNRLLVNTSSPEKQLEFYTSINLRLLMWIGQAIVRSEASEQRWQHLTAYHSFISAKEHFGAERGSATVLFARGTSAVISRQISCPSEKRF